MIGSLTTTVRLEGLKPISDQWSVLFSVELQPITHFCVRFIKLPTTLKCWMLTFNGNSTTAPCNSRSLCVCVFVRAHWRPSQPLLCLTWVPNTTTFTLNRNTKAFVMWIINYISIYQSLIILNWWPFMASVSRSYLHFTTAITQLNLYTDKWDCAKFTSYDFSVM